MATKAKYILKATLSGKDYIFTYEDTQVWQAIEDFYFSDYPKLIHLADSELFPVEVKVVADGKVITTYQFQFCGCVFDHFFIKGWKAGCNLYTLDEFAKDIELHTQKNQ